MQNKFATSQSQNESQPSSEGSRLVRYLQEKNTQQSFRKTSAPDSENDRINFCFNIVNSAFSVMRSYTLAQGLQTRLYYTKFTPRIKMGQVCIIHGYGESTDDYLRMAEFLAKRGNVVHMLDLRGFGYSGGSRVNQPVYQLLSDIETLLKNCCERNLSTFIIGQGLGSLLMQSLLQDNPSIPISGFISISPLFNFSLIRNTSYLQKFLYKTSPSIFGNILIHNMINPTALCKDPIGVKSKIQSVFSDSFITTKMINQFQQVGKKVLNEAYKFTYPVLLCYGSKDYIQSPQETKKHFLKLNSDDKQTVVFEEGYHELHKDYEAEELFNNIGRWIEARRGKKKWKSINSLEKGNYLRWNSFWRKFGIIVSLILLLIKLLKKMKGYIQLAH